MRLLSITPFRIANPDNGGKRGLYGEYEAVRPLVDDFLCLAVCTLKERGLRPAPPPFPYREYPTVLSLLLLLETVGMTSLPYFLSLRLRTASLAGQVLRFRPDVVEVFYPWLMPIRRYLPAGVKVVLRTYDVVTRWYEPMLSRTRLSGRWMKAAQKAERQAVKTADRVMCVTEYDRAYYIDRFGVPADKIAVVPCGYSFDTARFHRRAGSSGGRKRALFIGSDVYTNKAAVGVLIRDLAPRRPEVEFIVAGHVGRLLVRSALPPNVRVAGYVDQLDDLLSECDMLVCPVDMRTGISTKIAQALAFGLRVIATPEAGRGYESLAGKAVWVNPLAAFPDAIRRATRLSEKEWKQASRYDLKRIADEKRAVYKSLLQ